MNVKYLLRSLVTTLLTTAALAIGFLGAWPAIGAWHNFENAMSVHIGGPGSAGNIQCSASECWTLVSVSQPSKLQLIQAGDLAALDSDGVDRSASFPVIACGPWGGAPCTSASQARVEVSWVQFRSDCYHRRVIPGQWILFDIENWSLTPPDERANPALFVRKAIGTAHYNGLRIISTSNFRGQDENLAVVAAAAHTDAVSIQLQGATIPAVYASDTQQFVHAIRLVNASVPVIDGLATNPGGKANTADNMIGAYEATYHMVQGYWLNVPQWTRPGSCPDACAQVGRDFMTGIGAG